MSMEDESISYKRQESEGVLTICGAVDVFEASTLLDAARLALSDREASAVYIDVGGAERLDVSAIQILLALRRDVEATGRRFSIRGNASVLQKITRPLGVSFYEATAL